MERKPCTHRYVDEAGRILCNKVQDGDRQVSPTICRSCPIAEIDCVHLRASLTQATRSPILVRFGNGKTQLWDDPVAPLSFQHAACAAKTVPICSSLDCAGCSLHETLGSLSPLPNGAWAASCERPAEAVVAADTRPANPKIIRLEEWLTRPGKMAHLPRETTERKRRPPRARESSRVKATAEERAAGWTD
jgi:hypothetical protein